MKLYFAEQLHLKGKATPNTTTMSTKLTGNKAIFTRTRAKINYKQTQHIQTEKKIARKITRTETADLQCSKIGQPWLFVCSVLCIYNLMKQTKVT